MEPQQPAAPRAPAPRHKRSSRRHLLKAISWRAIGTVDTFVVSVLVLTYIGPWLGLAPPQQGHAQTAGLIAATEVFTKIGLFYLHELGWARLPWGARTATREKNWRSIVKAFSWRAFASLDTTLLALIFTGSLRMAVSIGGAEIFTKIALYYFHERAWERVPSRQPRP